MKYTKSVLWRVAKLLSYIEDVRCLKGKWIISINNYFLKKVIFHVKQLWLTLFFLVSTTFYSGWIYNLHSKAVFFNSKIVMNHYNYRHHFRYHYHHICVKTKIWKIKIFWSQKLVKLIIVLLQNLFKTWNFSLCFENFIFQKRLHSVMYSFLKTLVVYQLCTEMWCNYTSTVTLLHFLYFFWSAL